MDECYAWVAINIIENKMVGLGFVLANGQTNKRGKQWQNAQMKSLSNMTAVVFITIEMKVWTLAWLPPGQPMWISEKLKQNGPIHS